ncbi:MAG: NlpC/P60 family protein [Lachnospiraceae bacterium]|nr:NlpC/P60 family protein [Lachnospiraceae bacterium]
MENRNGVITRARSMIGQIRYTMNAPHLTPNRNMLRNNVRHQGLFWADCSSYTRWCFDVLGVNIGDWTAPQSEAGSHVWSGRGNVNVIPFHQLQMGDLIVSSAVENFWGSAGAGGHAAIFVGGRTVIGVNGTNPNAQEHDIANEFGSQNWFWRIRRIAAPQANVPNNSVPQPNPPNRPIPPPVSSAPVSTQPPQVISNRPNFTIGQIHRTQVDALRVRSGPGINHRILNQGELTQNGQANARNGMLNRNTAVTVLEVRNVGDDIWLRIPSGWIAGFHQGQVFVR